MMGKSLTERFYNQLVHRKANREDSVNGFSAVADGALAWHDYLWERFETKFQQFNLFV